MVCFLLFLSSVVNYVSFVKQQYIPVALLRPDTAGLGDCTFKIYRQGRGKGFCDIVHFCEQRVIGDELEFITVHIATTKANLS